MRAVVDVRFSTRPITGQDRGAATSVREPPDVQPRQPSRGFIVDRRGYIVTNGQPVRDVSTLEVILHDGRTLGATVVARDRLNDVALLKVERSGLPAIPLGDSGALALGERVLAIGRGADRAPTAAIVRATGAGSGGKLAIDLKPNPERIGAPLLNHLGQAVGIVTESAPSTSSPALTFAVPVDRVKPILAHLTVRPAAGSADPPAVR